MPVCIFQGRCGAWAGGGPKGGARRSVWSLPRQTHSVCVFPCRRQPQTEPAELHWQTTWEGECVGAAARKRSTAPPPLCTRGWVAIRRGRSVFILILQWLNGRVGGCGGPATLAGCLHWPSCCVLPLMRYGALVYVCACQPDGSTMTPYSKD